MPRNEVKRTACEGDRATGAGTPCACLASTVPTLEFLLKQVALWRYLQEAELPLPWHHSQPPISHPGFPGQVSVNQNHPNFYLCFTRACEGFLRSLQLSLVENSFLACIEDKCNHYQIFFTVEKSLEFELVTFFPESKTETNHIVGSWRTRSTCIVSTWKQKNTRTEFCGQQNSKRSNTRLQSHVHQFNSLLEKLCGWLVCRQDGKLQTGETYTSGDPVPTYSFLEEIPQCVQHEVKFSHSRSLHYQGHIYVGQINHVPVEIWKNS